MGKKCTKCNKAMKKGFHFRGVWMEGRPVVGKRFSKLVVWPQKKETENISCYICTSCGLVEFKVDTVEK